MKTFDAADIEDLENAVAELCAEFELKPDVDPIESILNVVNALQERRTSALKCRGNFAAWFKHDYPGSSVADFAFAREVWYAAVNVCYAESDASNDR